jgi:predicted amidophosphoribosyltransferase
MRFFCPGCWKDFAFAIEACPQCGINVSNFWDRKDLVEKLIHSLQHPEPSTPVRAAWLLGRIKDPRAVGALIKIIQKTRDFYLSREAVRALKQFATEEAQQFVDSLRNHPVRMIQVEVTKSEKHQGPAHLPT